MFFENPFLGALAIFFVRMLSVALSTVRILIMGRSRKIFVILIAFLESLAFVLTFGQVAQDLNNIWNLSGYVLGFSTGTIVGVWLEEHIVKSYSTINIISRGKSQEIIDAIHKAGYGATRSTGEGTIGMVGLIRSVVRRGSEPEIIAIATEIDGKAFVTIEETRYVRRGFLGFGRS